MANRPQATMNTAKIPTSSRVFLVIIFRTRERRLTTSSSANAKRGTAAAWLALLGAVAVTCVAVRWSAWLGDGSFDLFIFVRLMQIVCLLVILGILLDMLRINREYYKKAQSRKDSADNGNK